MFMEAFWERGQLRPERNRGEDNIRLRTSVLQPECHMGRGCVVWSRQMVLKMQIASAKKEFPKRESYSFHMPPMTALNPDGIAPVDLMPNDIWPPQTAISTRRAFASLYVISPHTKRICVSHSLPTT